MSGNKSWLNFLTEVIIVLPSKFVVPYKSNEEYDALVNKLMDIGYRWCCGNSYIPMQYLNGVLYAEEGNLLSYGSRDHYEFHKYNFCKDYVFLESLPELNKKEDNMNKTEHDPNGIDPNKPGAKLDAGKAPVRRGLLEYFPRSCMAVAQVSASGAKKYTWNGWEDVEGGIDRYGDAAVRHICKAIIEGPVDNDFGHLHAMHEAWNSLARLELILRKMEEEGHVNLY